MFYVFVFFPVLALYLFNMIPRCLTKRGLGSLGRAYFSTSLPANGKPPSVPPFDPIQHGLDANFILTNFTKMKG